MPARKEKEPTTKKGPHELRANSKIVASASGGDRAAASLRYTRRQKKDGRDDRSVEAAKKRPAPRLRSATKKQQQNQQLQKTRH